MSTLKLVRKKLPPARRVILDAKTKARRKRVKSASVEPTHHIGEGDWGNL